jgi:hypothetical protein
MRFADTQRLTHAAPVPRVGLRARWRAVREARMVSPRRRRQLAESIEHVVSRANTPRWALTAVIPVAPEAGRGARGALLDLAERLRGPRPVAPEGMRLAHDLLVDGAGPLYVPGEPGELRGAALRALWALDRRGVADR